MGLTWLQFAGFEMATLGTPLDGVTFTLSFHPTCYRRGKYRLLVEVHGAHHLWGCFDEQDQPMRYYFRKESALNEADEIADILLHDRYQKSPPLEVP